MTQHKPKYFGHDDGSAIREVRVACQGCGQTSGWQATRQMCEDWWLKHVDDIERIKAHLGGHSPSLAGQAKYYRMMSVEGRPGDRPLWAQMADELEHRLNAAGADEQDPLFEMP